MYYLSLKVCLFFIVYFMTLCALCNGVDLTLKYGTNGSSVVLACIAKMNKAAMFQSSDQQFLLRRIAYVETRDGEDYFSSSNDAGGIWQLSLSKYEETKKIVSQTFLDDIDSEFGITWANTDWSDLRKPFYSALAARLYLEIIPYSIPLATDITGQGNYWTNYYTSSGGTASDYISAINVLNDIEVCEVSGLDIIFILDSSGSVGSSNFQLMKNFVHDTVNGFDVGPNSVHVGVISYASSYTFHFYLSTYSSKSSVLSAISNIPYTGGGTNTAGAINAARNIGFTTGKGARPLNQGIPRIAIVVTDGKSNSYYATVSAAAAMHNAGIIGFAIGIAGADINELNQIASKPLYVSFIHSFNANLLSNLQVAISQETCEVSIDLPPEANITDTIEEGEIKYVNYPLPDDYSGITVQVNVSSGTCIVYGSTVIQTPSDAFYDVKLTTSGWKDTYVRQDNFTNSTTADRLYLAIESDENVNCTVTLSIDNGDTSTDPVRVSLYPASSAVYRNFGSEFIAYCYAIGKPLPIVKWYKDDAVVNSTIETTSEGYNVTSILTIPYITKDHEGTYRCTGSNTVPNGLVTDTKSFNMSIEALVMVINFRGIAVSSTAIYLSWDVPPVEGFVEDHFVVKCEELETNRKWTFYAVETHAHIISLHPYYSYSCTVQVVGENTSHPFSNPIIIVTNEAAPSDPPSSFTGTKEQTLSWNFSWIAPSSESINGVLLGYMVVCTSLSQHILSTNVSGAIRSVVLSSFQTETHYSCTVCAYTIVGCGPSASTQLITYEDSIIGPPLLLSVVRITATTVTLHWDPPFDPKNVTSGYAVTYSLIETQLFPSLETPRPSVTEEYPFSSFVTEHTLNSLLVGSQYEINIHAIYNQGQYHGPSTENIRVKTIDKDEYSVTDYHCESPSPKSLFCSWEFPISYVRLDVLEYQLAYRLAPGFDYYEGYGTELDRISTSPMQREYTITNLKPYAGYIVEVVCIAQLSFGLDVGIIVQSVSTLYQHTQQSIVAGIVENTSVVISTPTSVNITWTPPARDTWNGPISYIIKANGISVSKKRRKRNVAVTDSKVFNVSSQANHRDPSLAVKPLRTESYTITNLEENFRYSFSVTIVNSKGPGMATDPIEVTLAESAPSGPSVSITAINITSSSLTITWKPPNPFDANGVIVLYSLNFTHSDQHNIILRSATDDLIFKQKGLSPYEKITVAIAAKTVVGWGPYSQFHAFSTLEAESSKPTDLMDTLVNDSIVNLSWMPPRFPNGLIIGYQVTYSGHAQSQRLISHGPFALLVNSSTVQAQISNFIKGYFYEFKVCAINGAGLGENNTIVVLMPSEEINGHTNTASAAGSLSWSSTTMIGGSIGGLIIIIIVISLVMTTIVCAMKRKSRKQKRIIEATNRYALERMSTTHDSPEPAILLSTGTTSSQNKTEVASLNEYSSFNVQPIGVTPKLQQTGCKGGSEETHTQ